MKVFIYENVDGAYIWTRTLQDVTYIKINGEIMIVYTSSEEFKFDTLDYRFEVEVSHGC